MKLDYQLSDKNWQKFCAAEDWQHPDFQYILKHIFKRAPSFHRKQWEFVTLFINLHKCGKLNGETIGASFGAGKEPLIFNVLPYSKTFTATDLYSLNTGWQTAKLKKSQSPKDFVIDACPESISTENLSVKEMDMRKLEFADESLDYCYSSCAFEHIGHEKDFIKHLTEVKRVLKEDGVYVMTTEHLFIDKTIPSKGNYKFDMEYLQQLFEKSGLYPDPEFDCNLETSFLNKVQTPIQSIAGMSSLTSRYPAIIMEKQGVPYTSSCYVLRKTNQPGLLIDGVESTTKYIRKTLKTNVEKFYQNYQYLDPILNLNKQFRSVMSDHLQYITEDHDQYFPELKVPKGNIAYTDFIYFDSYQFKFVIDCTIINKKRLKFKLIQKPRLSLKNRKVIHSEIISFSATKKVVFTHQANPQNAYAVAISTVGANNITLSDLHIRVKIV